MSISEGSITQVVNELLKNALTQSASDIHIEPMTDYYRIRMRLNGLLYSMQNIHTELAQRCILRLKVLALLDIAEKRLPQDGHFSFQYSNLNCDIRLSTCPTYSGEKAVLRLLNYAQPASFSELGMLPHQVTQFELLLNQPEGLILIAGPTGCGKTATLYSALAYLNQTQHNIISIEDPIEIHLPGINQVNINPKIGFDFPNALRSFLRQDPDIIMVGEIRDLKTAQMALHAAQTGHLILSSIHTNHLDSGINRLKSLGINSSELQGIHISTLSQRLVRKRCIICKNPPLGCSACQDGYQGRTGIFSFNQSLNNITETQALLNITTQEEIDRVIPKKFHQN